MSMQHGVVRCSILKYYGIDDVSNAKLTFYYIFLFVCFMYTGPCKMMAPEMEKVAEELGSKCRVAKLDSDQHPEWAGRYKVQGLPTILLIHRGQVQERLEGAFMKDKLLEMVQPYI